MNINGDGEMAPRMKITATPYSFRSGQSDTLTNGSGTISASQLVQLSPSAMQTTNSAGAGIMLDQTGTGGLLQLRGNGSDVLTLSKTGNLLAAGLLNINGASVTVGTATQQGSLILNDGSGKTASILPTALSANTTYTLPSTGGIFCMQSSSGCGFASSSLAFANGGNLFGGLASLGTNDNNALAFRTNSAEVARFTAGGSLVIGGGATTSRNGELVDINGSLRSNKLLVGSGADFSILPVASGQSVVSSLWGLQLVGNKQTAVDYSPANIGLKDDFSVIIPNQQATKTALVIKGQTSQSGDLIQLQDISGQTLSRFDATGQLVLGNDAATPTPAKIILNDATAANGFTSSLTTSNLTSSRNISLPDEGGVVCLSNSNNCGYIRLASGTAQTDATANNTIFINKTNASGSLISLTNTGNSVFTVANNGALEIRSTSTVALNIKNATGTDFFNVDTSGGIVRIGPAVGDTTGVMLVLDSKTSAGDPTGSNGGMYYNANGNKFRCFENSTWNDCISETVKTKTADQTVTNNATFQNDTDLAFPVLASSYYTFKAAINYSSTNATADYKFTFTAPAGSTVYITAVSPVAGTDGATNRMCNISASGTSCSIPITAANYRGTTMVTGYVQTGATSGNVQYQFAQNVLTAGQSVTVYRGSEISYRRTQ